jgi:hypothetical protein
MHQLVRLAQERVERLAGAPGGAGVAADCKGRNQQEALYAALWLLRRLYMADSASDEQARRTALCKACSDGVPLCVLRQQNISSNILLGSSHTSPLYDAATLAAAATLMLWCLTSTTVPGTL